MKPALPPESSASRELRLFADNDAQLHRSSMQPIRDNLGKKMDKGVYDKDKIIATLKANGAKMCGVKWAPERIAKRSATRRANTILRKQLTGDAA